MMRDPRNQDASVDQTRMALQAIQPDLMSASIKCGDIGFTPAGAMLLILRESIKLLAVFEPEATAVYLRGCAKTVEGKPMGNAAEAASIKLQEISAGRMESMKATKQ